MAFVTDVREFQALLDPCSSTQEWQMLMDYVLIPDEWMTMAYARLTELTVQELEVSCNILLDLCFHSYVENEFYFLDSVSLF